MELRLRSLAPHQNVQTLLPFPVPVIFDAPTRINAVLIGRPANFDQREISSLIPCEIDQLDRTDRAPTAINSLPGLIGCFLSLVYYRFTELVRCHLQQRLVVTQAVGHGLPPEDYRRTIFDMLNVESRIVKLAIAACGGSLTTLVGLPNATLRYFGQDPVVLAAAQPGIAGRAPLHLIHLQRIAAIRTVSLNQTSLVRR